MTRKELHQEFDLAVMSLQMAQRASVWGSDLEGAIRRVDECYARLNAAADALYATPSDSSIRAENV